MRQQWSDSTYHLLVVVVARTWPRWVRRLAFVTFPVSLFLFYAVTVALCFVHLVVMLSDMLWDLWFDD